MLSDSGSDGRAPWPAVGYESTPWEADPAGYSSRRQALRARGPYLSAVPVAIAESVPSVPDAIAAEAEDAIAELARFDAEVGRIAAPFSSILLRSESASSSEIEQLTSGARAVAVAELGARSTPNARLIVSNVRAMESALELADELDAAAIIRMQAALLGESQPDHVGRFRQQPVWVGGSSPHSARFVPPRHERVPAAIDDLVAFARRVDVPLLVQIAVAHAQFETIHPFPDGNGRTGRALVQAMLRAGRITRAVTVPVSAGLLGDTARYFGALTAYREGDLLPIVGEFTRAAFAAVQNGRMLVDELDGIQLRWLEVSTARAGSTADRLVRLLPEHPVLDGAMAARLGGVTLANALLALARLEDDGILSRLNSGARNRLWQADEVLDALDRFAERARRGR